MKKNPNRLWILVLVLGWLFDFLFWKKAPGVNFAIYAVLCLVSGFLVLRMEGLRPARGALWLLLPILFFAVITFVHREPMTTFLSVAFALFLMGLLASTFLGGRWLGYSLADYVSGFLRLMGSMIGRPLSFAAEVRREQAAGGATKPKRSLWPILRGILIALPILAIFASLLASADVIFGQRLDQFIRIFRLEKLPEYLFRAAYILLGAYLLAGVFLHAASQSKDEKLLGGEKPLMSAFLGFTEAVIVLGSVLILFAAFVVIQFQYFFGGQANVHIDGYTYSEYARRGFGELVTVAFFSLLLILGLSAITRRENESQRRVFSGLGIGVVALVLVMLLSAYQRLVLYETAYGFSRLRAYTHVFLVWIGLLLVAVVLLEILRRERAFAAAALLASMGFAASLALMNVDAFIVQQNVQRAAAGQKLDVGYLVSLSDDAIPALAKVYQSPTLPESVREASGAALACIHSQRAADKRRLSWQSFHLSRLSADRALASLEASLKGYRYDHSGWPAKVVAPSGEEYLCSSYKYMD